MSKATFKRNLHKQMAQNAKDNQVHSSFQTIFPKLHNTIKMTWDGSKSVDAFISDMMKEIGNEEPSVY